MRVPSERERKLAARIRVRADKQLGYRTPEWIVELAKGKPMIDHCTLMGCKAPTSKHHHHYSYGHLDTYACACSSGGYPGYGGK